MLQCSCVDCPLVSCFQCYNCMWSGTLLVEGRCPELQCSCNLYFFLHRKALKAWSSSSNLVLLGNTLVPRLPIFSFLIRHPTTGAFLHHNYVCVLLNDLFGIQARGGCACAGPYAQVSAIFVLIIYLLTSSNRPFYCCLLRDLAFEWLRGWR